MSQSAQYKPLEASTDREMESDSTKAKPVNDRDMSIK